MKALQACSAVIVAAGRAARMQGIDKLLAPLCGECVLLRTLRALAASEEIEALVLVARADMLAQVRALCAGEQKLRAVVPGGESRAESVLCGLAAVETPLVAIHDGARPLVTRAVIEEAIAAARECGAAAPAIAVKDTVKCAQDGLVVQTPPRSTLFAVQTPQVFYTAEILAAVQQARARGLPVTDDCSAAEAAGLSVRLTRGSEENLKITTPLDLVLAEAILKRRCRP